MPRRYGSGNGCSVPVLSAPSALQAEGGAALVDGGNNLGMPAFRLATDHLIREARARGLAAVGVAKVDHTGRIGAFVKRGAARRVRW